MATKTAPAKAKAKPSVQKSEPSKAVPKSESTALANLSTLLPNVADFAPALQGTSGGMGPGLPVFKIVWPIEASPDVGKCVINIGGENQPLLAPYLVSCLGVRNMSRDLVNGNGGQQVYSRKYEGGKSDTEYQQFVKEGKQCGKAILLALIPEVEEGDTCLICMMDLAGTAEGYFMPCFVEGLFGHGKGSVISLVDHMPNLVPSKKDKTRKYFAPWKFTQHEGRDLTNQEKLLIAEACTNAAAAITVWKNQ